MQSVFWPVSLDQCAVGPWLLQAEFNFSTEPWAHSTHNLHKHMNTHMLTWGIVRYMSTEWMSTERMHMFCSSSCHHLLIPLSCCSSPFLPYLWQTSTQTHLDVRSFHMTLFLFTVPCIQFCIPSNSVQSSVWIIIMATIIIRMTGNNAVWLCFSYFYIVKYFTFHRNTLRVLLTNFVIFEICFSIVFVSNATSFFQCKYFFCFFTDLEII